MKKKRQVREQQKALQQNEVIEQHVSITETEGRICTEYRKYYYKSDMNYTEHKSKRMCEINVAKQVRSYNDSVRSSKVVAEAAISDRKKLPMTQRMKNWHSCRKWSSLSWGMEKK